MARIKNKFPEVGTGSLGHIVIYNMYGNTYMRSRPEDYNDSKTLAQLAQRKVLEIVNDFQKPFKFLIRKTFANEAVGRSAYHAAHSFNMKNAIQGEYPNQSIRLESAYLSKGPVQLPTEFSAAIKPDGILLTWDTKVDRDKGCGYDTLVVMARDAQNKFKDYQFTGVRRKEGSLLWKTSLSLDKGPLDVWIAFRNPEETEISDSLYTRAEI